jgi:NAD(P)-dependent dehydrogenase (short-subunit alcohol dehydrogenase family)
MADSPSRRGVAVVTGGASGFGRAIADRCADHGFDVALLDIDGERAAAEAASLTGERGVRATGLRVDVGDSKDVDAAAAAVERELGAAALVFSNVGVQQIGAFDGFGDDAWSWMLDINVMGSARVARSFLPQLRRSDDAHVAFTASSSVLVPATHLAAYQTTKFAVLGLAETLNLEWAADGIAVSVVFPSGMMTRHLESSLAARPGSVAGEIAPAGDIEAMIGSNPGFATDVATADAAARHVVDEVLAGERYIVTHGDLVDGISQQQQLVRRAAERARDRNQERS